MRTYRLFQWANSHRPFRVCTTAVFAVAAFAVDPPLSHAALSCSIGWTACVSSQGTMIPSKTVIDMLGHCDSFTRNNIGYRALSLSVSEILKANEDFERRTGQRISPLFDAHDAWERLYDSDLRFDRRGVPPAEQYAQIKRSCAELRRDFNDDTKWRR